MIKRLPRESLVMRVLKVQALYLEHKEADITNVYIYRKYIYPEFFISERTFYRYLDRNAKKELKQIINHKNEQKNEVLPLFEHSTTTGS